MSQRPPFVSILIPAAGERFFAHALASACSQRYPLLEIVVCDDSPGDAVRDAVAAALDPRVRYLRNPVPLGRCGAFTRCLSAARGAYVKFLDDSDRLLPGCVETLAGMLDNPAVRLATSRRLLIDAAGAPRPDPAANVPVSRVSALVRGRELGELALLGGSNLIGGPAATMFRRADLAIEAEDAFRWGGRSYRCLADLGMWLRLLSRGLAYYHAEPLSEHRIHDCGEPTGWTSSACTSASGSRGSPGPRGSCPRLRSGAK